VVVGNLPMLDAHPLVPRRFLHEKLATSPIAATRSVARNSHRPHTIVDLEPDVASHSTLGTAPPQRLRRAPRDQRRRRRTPQNCPQRTSRRRCAETYEALPCSVANPSSQNETPLRGPEQRARRTSSRWAQSLVRRPSPLGPMKPPNDAIGSLFQTLAPPRAPRGRRGCVWCAARVTRVTRCLAREPVATTTKWLRPPCHHFK